MREPVVIAPDEQRPETWMVGDSEFFYIEGQSGFLVFTVSHIDALHGPVFVYTGINVKNQVTGQVAEPYVSAYIQRLKPQNSAESQQDIIWKAIQDFSKPS